MRTIYYIIGRSGSGKDTIYKELIKSDELKELNLKEIVLFTTRPIRNGETNGKEYFFVSNEEFEKMKFDNKFIETREYDVVNGVWKYGTSIESFNQDGTYIGIGTLESYEKIKKELKDNIYPIYISVDESILYNRTMKRGQNDSNQNIEEIKRRFEADSIDFSEEKLKKMNIDKKFENNKELKECVNEIIYYILNKRKE